MILSINTTAHENKFDDDHFSFESEDQDYSDDAHVGAPLLRHAKEIYISNIAHMFQKEYKKSQYLVTSSLMATIKDGRINVSCNVFKAGHSGERIVHARPSDGTISCSCNKFEHDGILCSHALVVLACLCIVRIPPQYIHDKFLKNVMAQVKDIHGPWYSDNMRFLCYTAVERQFGMFLGGDAPLEIARTLFDEGLGGASSKPVDDNTNGVTAKTRKTGCEAWWQKEQKKEVRFSDDQALKNFVYKELKLQGKISEATKAKRKLQKLYLTQPPHPGLHGMRQSRLHYYLLVCLTGLLVTDHQLHAAFHGGAFKC